MGKKMLFVCGAVMALACTVFGWTAGELTVDVVKSPMNIKVSAGTKTLVEITRLSFGPLDIDSISTVAETTDSMVLTLSENTSLLLTAVQGGIRFYSKNNPVDSVMLTLKDQGEHFYGITQHNIATGDKSNPDLRGMTVYDKVSKVPDEDAETYGGFFFTTLGYAGFFDGFFNGKYVFGSSSKTTIASRAPSINWYLFYGPKLSKIQQSFFKVIGAPKKVPMWACGPLIWHDNCIGSQMLIDYAKKFEEVKIPYSIVSLKLLYPDASWGSYWSMSFGGKFANPELWIKELSDTFYVKLATEIMPRVFPGDTAPAGALPKGSLDLTLADNVTWYKNKLKTVQYPYGVKGHKMGSVDNGWGTGGTVELPPFSDGTPAEERHHKYVYLNAKVTDECLRTVAGLGDDHFNFSCVAVPRCQQYISAIWNGDTYANWPGMITSLGNAIRAGFLGWPMWGSTICGYKQTAMPDSNNYCRWLSFGAYSGFMELMLDGKEPWKIKQIQDQVCIRNLFNLRFTLLPYIYSILNTSADLGVTMMPLVGEYPDERATYSMYDEYLFGPAMLVAPIYSSSDSRSVYLPTGKWINQYNYADVQTGPKTITTAAMSLTQMPVYIKSNSIYPTGKIFAGTAKKWEPDFDGNRNVVINVFPGDAGESNTFTYVDYLDGDAKKALSVEAYAGNIFHVKSPALTVPGTVSVRLQAAPTKVTFNGVDLSSSQYTYNADTLRLDVPFAAGTAVDLRINGMTNTINGAAIPMLRGHLQIRKAGNGLRLVIPAAAGLKNNSRIEAVIFDMHGRKVWNSGIEARRICSAPCFIGLERLSSGSYIAQLRIDGVVARRGLLVAPR